MGGRFLGSNLSARFCGVSTDTRELRAGEIFFCLVGERDGHSFAARAADLGAACIVMDEFHQATHSALPADAQVLVVPDTLRALGDLARAWRRRFSIPVLAITGSNGKTTTKELTAALLRRRYRVLATEGNFNNLIGVPKTLFRLSPEDEVAVVEMGMNDFGEIARLTEIAEPTFGLITNIGAAHLEKLGGLDGVTRAKGELFAGLNPEAVAIINTTDSRLAALPVSARVFRFGGKDTEIHGEVLPNPPGDPHPLHLRIFLGGQEMQLAMKVPGPHHLSNVLAALSVAKLLDIPPLEARAALEAFVPSASRMELVTLPSGRHLLDDCYNANPTSTTAALHTLAQLKEKNQALAILGEMLELGASSVEGHREVGRAAAKTGTDWLYAIGPHAEDILAGAREAGFPEQRQRAFSDTETAAEALSELPGEVKWLLVKGSRGVHLEKIVQRLKEKF